MKSFRNVCVALLFGCFMPVLIWVGVGTAVYQFRKEAKQVKQAIPDSVCSIDTDCPPGYICISGRCVPAH